MLKSQVLPMLWHLSLLLFYDGWTFAFGCSRSCATWLCWCATVQMLRVIYPRQIDALRLMSPTRNVPKSFGNVYSLILIFLKGESIFTVSFFLFYSRIHETAFWSTACCAVCGNPFRDRKGYNRHMNYAKHKRFNPYHMFKIHTQSGKIQNVHEGYFQKYYLVPSGLLKSLYLLFFSIYMFL